MQTLSAVLHQGDQDPALQEIILALASAGERISAKLRLGALASILGDAKKVNVQGEQQKKLDIIANQIVIDKLSSLKAVAGMASEEEEQFITGHPEGRYLVMFDPLDGSSNIDIDISVGTIFSLFMKPRDEDLQEKHFLQPGNKQVAAGYILYGPQTLLVMTFGQEVLFFTLDHKGEFRQQTSPPSLVQETQEFAINMSNQRFWPKEIQKYITFLLQGKEGPRGKDYNMRWVASMVAEIHRILLRGGVFIYPQDSRSAYQHGKLRLLYEVNPMSFLIKAAGGKASVLPGDPLELKPNHLHQRVPIALGVQQEIEAINKQFTFT
jgi:fructose-1,6-bisphosphatase class 1